MTLFPFCTFSNARVFTPEVPMDRDLHHPTLPFTIVGRFVLSQVSLLTSRKWIVLVHKGPVLQATQEKTETFEGSRAAVAVAPEPSDRKRQKHRSPQFSEPHRGFRFATHSVNKAQGLTLKKVCFNVREHPFAHRQQYVVTSRVRNRRDILMLKRPSYVHDG